MFRIFIAVLVSFCCLSAIAQRLTPEQYVDMYKDMAIKEMQRSGVPAAVTLAQGILETESGNSELVKKSNNHFGIKCKSNWQGESVSHDDDANGECFRAYQTAAESFKDHSDFLKNNQRYASLFTLDAKDYAAWAKGLKKAGYATNPRYPDILIKNIEQYNLQQYTLAALNGQYEMDIAKTDAVNSIAKYAKEEDQGINKDVTAIPESGIVTSVNNVKCIYAKKGTSLLAIALKNNVNLSKLLEYNEENADGILDKDQYIYLHKKAKTGQEQFYIIKPGETVYDAAQINGILLQYLKEYNNLSNERILPPYTRLKLQPGATIPTVYKEVVTKPQPIVHKVEPREGLYSIARKYNVTIQQLREWNNLESDNLNIGQDIIIAK